MNLSAARNWATRPEITIAMGLLLTAFVLFGVYKPGLKGPLILDDIPQLGGFIDTPAEQIWANPAAFFRSSSGQLGRPVAMLSFALGLETGVNPAYMWKLTNLGIHAVNGILLFWICSILLRAEMSRKGSLALAGACALLWLVHPLHVSTVLYTVQRMTLLANLFMFAGLLFYWYGRETLPDAPIKGWALMGIAFAVCFPLGVLSKELAIVFPAYCALVEYLYFRERSDARTRRRILAFFALVLVLPALLGFGYLLWNHEHFLVDSYATRDFTLIERLLTEPRVISLYMLQTFVPLQSLMGFLHDDISVSTGPLSPPSTLGAMLLLASLAYIAWRCRRRHRIVAFALFGFFLSHALESSIFALELMYEHRNYLGSFLLLAALSYTVSHFFASTPPRTFVAVCAGVTLTFILSQRVATWSSEESLTKYMLATHPQSVRLLHSYLPVVTASGDYARAERMLRGRDKFRDRLQRLYIGCKRDARLTDSDLRAAHPEQGHVVDIIASGVLIDLANFGLDGSCSFSPRAFVDLMNRALELPVLNDLVRYRLLVYLALYQRTEGDLEAATQALLAAYDADPSDARVVLMAIDWLDQSGHRARARELMPKALQAIDNSRLDYSRYFSALKDRLETH